MLVLLIFKSMFKNRKTLSELHLNEKDRRDSNHFSTLNFSNNLSYGEEMSEKDFSVFTIYEPDLVSTHVSSVSAVGEKYQIKHTPL